MDLSEWGVWLLVCNLESTVKRTFGAKRTECGSLWFSHPRPSVTYPATPSLYVVWGSKQKPWKERLTPQIVCSSGDQILSLTHARQVHYTQSPWKDPW